MKLEWLVKPSVYGAVHHNSVDQSTPGYDTITTESVQLQCGSTIDNNLLHC